MIRQVYVQRLLTAAKSAEIRRLPAQPYPTNFSKLSTKPVVCLSGMPNITFSVRQAWVAASLNCCRSPCLPVGGGIQTIWDQTRRIATLVASNYHYKPTCSWFCIL